MNSTRTLKLTLHGEREIVITREFDAPRTLVWDAFTNPELLRKWLLGPPGWTLAVCQTGAKVGDRYRYVWRGPDGFEMGMGGVVREFVPPERMVATEKFDQSWYPGEAVGTIVLIEHNGKTTLTQTIQYESREAREIALKSPMEQGMNMSYSRLDEILASVS